MSMELALEFERIRNLDDEAILADLGHLLREERQSGRFTTLAASSFDAVGSVSDSDFGRNTWETLKRLAAKNICEQEAGLKKIVERSKLEEAIAAILTPILTGYLGGLGPAAAVIIAACVTLAIRTGIDTFCELCAQ